MVFNLTPLGAASFGVQALSSAFAYADQVKQAKQIAKQQKKMQEESVEKAAQFASESYNALLARKLQIGESTAQAKFSAKRQARKAAAAEKVSAGAAGVQGTTAGDVQREFSRQLEDFVATTNRNYQFQKEQLDREFQAVQVQQDNAIYRAQTPNEPNPFGTIASIAGSYMQSYVDFKKAQND